MPVGTAALLLCCDLQLLSADSRDHLPLTSSCQYTEALTRLFVFVCAHVPKFLIDCWTVRPGEPALWDKNGVQGPIALQPPGLGAAESDQSSMEVLVLPNQWWYSALPTLSIGCHLR